MKNLHNTAALLCLLPTFAWGGANPATTPDLALTEASPVKHDRASGWAELGLAYADLSNFQSSWKDAYLKGHVQLTPTDGIQGEISNQRHFDDRGTFFGASWNHVFNDDWYGSLAVGSSNGGFFLPEFRVDATLYRKWLPQRQLVTGATLGYYRAKDVHYDNSLVLNAVYYFDGPWIAEGGVRLNESNPGNVTTARGFAAITWGRDKERYIVLRHDSGREGYQLIAAGTAVTDFSSRETTLTWREWLSPKGGINLSATHYASPNYRRSGISIGLFHDF